MTHVSRKKVDREVLNKILNFLVSALAGINNEEQMRQFMDSFFTETERLMLAKRLGVVYLLSQNVPIEKICKILSVTPATVGRMKLWLRLEGKGYQTAFSVLQRAEKLKLFKKFMLSLLEEIGKPYYKKSFFGIKPE